MVVQKPPPTPASGGQYVGKREFRDWFDVYYLYQIILSHPVSTAGGGIKGGGLF